ncbi:hypothetical protein FOZ60_012210 [Perkinsus olseni]|uniref:Uncharacterized protein n=1 Tax=Perkinsus olseni TaxID=32597 RepID=A0A7J6ND41_PEROL|nr:hypothetical protein FOZ60_012210 [Perkinsus olseni]
MVGLLGQVPDEAPTRAPSVPAPTVRLKRKVVAKIDVPNQGWPFQGRESLDYPVSKRVCGLFYFYVYLSPAVESESMSYMVLKGAVDELKAMRTQVDVVLHDVRRVAQNPRRGPGGTPAGYFKITPALRPTVILREKSIMSSDGLKDMLWARYSPPS